MLISYAQNFEDVMLWRALRHVSNGFYIDVGANDPIIDSVTHLFYQRGWRGINVEPLRCHFDDLQRERPEDVNLLCAAGPFEGEIELVDFAVRGWATADKAAVLDHRSHGSVGKPIKVPITTLAAICERHAASDIHFLKIDVEGYEAAVLESMDFVRFRPWILVVEATRPNSTDQMHAQWESLLLGASYRFVYADGLNRFYLASERSDLALAFEFPPNVFDDFVKAPQWTAERRAAQAEALAGEALAARAQAEVRLAEYRALAERRADQAERRADQAERRADQAHLEAMEADARTAHAAIAAEQAQRRVSDLLDSTSWRVTAPMRRATGGLYRVGRSLKGWMGVGIRRLGTQVRARPRLKRALLAILAPFPSLSWRLRTGSFDPRPAHGISISSPSPNPRDRLPPRVRRIHATLTTELAKRKDEGT